MNSHRFNKGIEELKKIHMTDAEKKAVFARIAAVPISAGSVEESPIQTEPIKSPWTIYSFRSWIEQNNWAYIVAVLVIILFAGGGVASAAQSTVPGDMLYPFKINVTEPIRVALALTQEAKAAVEASIATARLQEAETLAAQGKLDASNQAGLQASLNAYAAKFNSSLALIEKSGSSDLKAIVSSATTTPSSSTTVASVMSSLSSRAEEVKMDFHATLNAHARILDLIAAQATTTDKTAVVDIAAAARKNAAPFRFAGTSSNGSVNIASSTVNFNVQGQGKNGNNGKQSGYGHRRQSIEALINDTNHVLQNITVGSTSWDQSIASGTVETLNRADQSLQAADQENSTGAPSASMRLLQSEQAATEANIFLKAGLKFSNRFNNGRGNSKNQDK